MSVSHARRFLQDTETPVYSGLVVVIGLYFDRRPEILQLIDFYKLYLAQYSVR